MSQRDLFEGVVIAQTKVACTRHGLIVEDKADAALLLSIDLAGSSVSPVASIRAAVVERWRVSGRDQSWAVTVADRSVAVATEPKQPSREVMDAIETAVAAIADARKRVLDQSRWTCCEHPTNLPS